MEVSSLEAPPAVLRLDHPAKVGEVRRLAVSMAVRLGLDEQDQGRLAIVVTEAANNAVQHGGGGEIVLRPILNSARGVEALIVDKGSGISNLERALRDGYSTAGTPGTGLGAVARLSDRFDIYSAVDSGTAVLTEVWSGGSRGEHGPAGDRLETGVVCVPKAGERECGDAWAIRYAGDRILLTVADGLGHGPDAAQASTQAISLFQRSRMIGPADLLAEMHGALRSTRGAAVAVASLNPATREILYAGVGNIAATIVTGEATRSMVSHNGTVGHEVRKIQEFQYPWPAEALVVMQSDGLQTHWRLDRYPGLMARSPSLIAATLYRDFTRGRDDVTVLAVREMTSRSETPA
jgi:anti-sigma regulatory factor (Ser/Thr protein kinase)